MTAEIKQALRQWIADKRELGNHDMPSDDTALLETGLLRSIDIADLMIFIEFLRERPIEIGDLKPGVFASIDDIAAQFFAVTTS